MFGRLLSFEPDATGVTVKFEHKEGRISFITDRIVRVYSSMEEKHRPSRAVVQEPKKVDFQARQQKEFITIKTKKLLVRVRDEFQVDFLTPDGRMISALREYADHHKRAGRAFGKRGTFSSKRKRSA